MRTVNRRVRIGLGVQSTRMIGVLDAGVVVLLSLPSLAVHSLRQPLASAALVSPSTHVIWSGVRCTVTVGTS